MSMPSTVLPSATTALDTPFSVSVLTVTKGHASKQLLVGAEGRPIKGEGSLAIARGVIEHPRVTGLAGLQALLMSIRKDQALVHGVVKGSSPGDVRPLVTTEVLKQTKPDTLVPGTVARSLEFLAYPDDHFLLMFDRDDHEEDPTKLQTAEDLFQLLAPLLPGIAEAGGVGLCSTSSAIRSKATQEWLIPPSGFHVYYLAREILRASWTCSPSASGMPATAIACWPHPIGRLGSQRCLSVRPWTSPSIARNGSTM